MHKTQEVYLIDSQHSIIVFQLVQDQLQNKELIFQIDQKSLYENAKTSQEYLDESYRELSDSFDVDPNKVIIDYAKPLENKIFEYELNLLSIEELSQLPIDNYSVKQKQIIEKVVSAVTKGLGLNKPQQGGKIKKYSKSKKSKIISKSKKHKIISKSKKHKKSKKNKSRKDKNKIHRKKK